MIVADWRRGASESECGVPCASVSPPSAFSSASTRRASASASLGSSPPSLPSPPSRTSPPLHHHRHRHCRAKPQNSTPVARIVLLASLFPSPPSRVDARVSLTFVRSLAKLLERLEMTNSSDPSRDTCTACFRTLSLKPGSLCRRGTTCHVVGY